MKKAVTFGITSLILISLIYWGMRCQSGNGEQDANADTQITPVKRGDLAVTVIETGVIEAIQKVEVKSRVSGRIKKILVQEGETVQQGQLLAIIDPQEVNLQLEQSSAQLRGAESAYRRSQEQSALTAKQVQNALEQAQANYEQAKREWEAQPELSRTAIEQAKAAHENAKSRLELLKLTTHPQERVQSETELNRAKAALEADERNLERLNILEKGYVSQREVDSARAQREASKATLARAEEAWKRIDEKQKIELAQAEQSVRDTQAFLEQTIARSKLDRNKYEILRSAEAQLKQAKENLRQMKIEQASTSQAKAQADQVRANVADTRRQLSETSIRAPMSGVITKKLVEEGELVTALSSFTGGTPIVEVAKLDRLQVNLDVNEIDVAKLQEGIDVQIEIDALPEDKFMGKLIRIAPSSTATGPAGGAGSSPAQQTAVVRYRVEVELASNNPKIRPGMSAKCTMFVDKSSNTLSLPIEYVGRDQKGHFVMLVEERAKEGKPAKTKRVEVDIGLTSATSIEIVSGIKEGDLVQKPPFKGPDRESFIRLGPRAR
jgi:HlyD family secretion protein